MTVHKSQGSEFNDVALVLPETDYPVLSRELIYTGITRAKRRVFLIGNEGILHKTIQRRIERASGLKDLLWNG